MNEITKLKIEICRLQESIYEVNDYKERNKINKRIKELKIKLESIKVNLLFEFEEYNYFYDYNINRFYKCKKGKIKTIKFFLKNDEIASIIPKVV